MQFPRFFRLLTEKKYIDPDLGEVIFRKKKGLKRLSIRIHPTKGVSVSVPYLVPCAVALTFFNLKRNQVLQVVEKQRVRYNSVPKVSQEDVENMRCRAKEFLPGRLQTLASRYGFIYNRVTIKHNSTNWGSCSTKGNINLNLNLIRLPLPLIDYILLHELCHLQYLNHGEKFHILLEKLCQDNLCRLLDEGNTDAVSLAKSVARSRARFPLEYTCSRSLKAYPLV